MIANYRLDDDGSNTIGGGRSKRSRLSFSVSALTLGSVQFGLRYGIVHPTDLPSEVDVFAALDAAADAGITVVDTARAYGCAESRIGRWLAFRPHATVSVITKVPKLPLGSPDARCGALRNAVDASRAALGMDRLPLVLVHEERDLLDPAVVEEFERLIEGGSIGQFGASVYDPEVAMQLIEKTSIAALQLPFSIFDRRFERAGVLSHAACRGVVVFSRSALLQGTLLLEPDRLPAYLNPLADAIRRLRALAVRTGLSLFDLSLIPLRDHPAIGSIVVGVAHADQLAPHLQGLRGPILSPDVYRALDALSATLDDAVVDPSRWRSLAAST